MAYVNKEKKAKIREALKLVIPKSWKWSLAVRHHSSIVLNIRSAPVDLIKESSDLGKHVNDGYFSPNEFYIEDAFSESKELFLKILDALNTDNFDKSDIQSDYFHVGHYVDINIGRFDKPFEIK